MTILHFIQSKNGIASGSQKIIPDDIIAAKNGYS